MQPSPPGAAIDAALDYDASQDHHRFAVLACALRDMDLLRLGDAHRRAQYRAAEDWRGRWVTP